MSWKSEMLMLIARTCLRCERILVDSLAKDRRHVMAHADEQVRYVSLAKRRAAE